MALISCPECGRQVSDRAATCPDCGCPISATQSEGVSAQSNTALIENYLTLARNAFDASNNKEAEDYASKILELDATNAMAWMIKGAAIGWQSTVSNIRFAEMNSCWDNCLAHLEPENRNECRGFMTAQATALVKALVNVNADNFSENPSEDNLTRLKNCWTTFLTTGATWIHKLIIVDVVEMSEYIADRMNRAAVAGSNVADKNYGPERRDKTSYAYRRWINENDNCISLLEVALALTDEESMIDRIVKNLTILQENAINSCSYKFDTIGYTSGYYQDQVLTDSAKQFRRSQIAKYKSEAKNKIKKKKEEEEKKRREEQEKRNKEYWDSHAEERKQLETRKTELEANIKQLDKEQQTLEKQLKTAKNKERTPVAADAEREKICTQINMLFAQKNALGLFKGKEKKALQAQIDELEAQLATVNQTIKAQEKERDDKIAEETAPISAEIASLSKKKRKIQCELDKVKEELTKNR